MSFGIGEYCVFPGGQKNCGKLSPYFYFQKWESVQICIFLWKIFQDLHLLGKNCKHLHLLRIKGVNPTHIPPKLIFSRIFTYEFWLCKHSENPVTVMCSSQLKGMGIATRFWKPAVKVKKIGVNKSNKISSKTRQLRQVSEVFIYYNCKLFWDEEEVFVTFKNHTKVSNDNATGSDVHKASTKVGAKLCIFLRNWQFTLV